MNKEVLIIEEENYRECFEGVLQVSEHCAWDVLLNYIRERQRTDITSLLGSCFYVEVLQNIENPVYQDLLNGGVYEDNEGKSKIHYGLRTILAHLAYAAYAYRGGMVDTPFSFVQKRMQDSIPVPINELRNIHDENRAIANDYWKLTQEYLCDNKELFENFDSKDCASYGCNDDDSCESGGLKSHRTAKMTIIRK